MDGPLLLCALALSWHHNMQLMRPTWRRYAAQILLVLFIIPGKNPTAEIKALSLQRG
jgi:hypothetical protein